MKFANAAGCVAGCGLLVCASKMPNVGLKAQTFVPVEISNYTAPITDERGGKAAIVRGAKGKQIAPGVYELTEISVETFRGDDRDLIIEAARCVFDQKEEVVTSDGELTARAANERLSISGKGFRWKGSDSRLVISNSVQTVLRKQYFDLGGAQSLVETNRAAQTGFSRSEPSNSEAEAVSAPKGQIEIRSNRMELKTAIAVFSGQVRARDASSEVLSDVLTATFGESVEAVERIEARGSVTIRANEMFGRGDTAIYSVREETITLARNAHWSIGDKEGSAEVILVNKKTNELDAQTNVWVKLAANDVVPLSLFPEGPRTPQARKAPAPIEIRAGQLKYLSNTAFIEGNVRVQSGADGMLVCDALEAKFAEADGKLTGFTAERSVRFEQEQGKASVFADRAAYDSSRNLLIMTGNPGWRFEQGQGTSDRIVYDSSIGRLRAEGHVDMTFVQGAGELPDFSFGKRRGAGPAAARPDLNLEVRVQAGVLYFKPGSAIFLDRVRAVLPSGLTQNLRCEVLAAFYEGPENRLEHLVAEDNVEIRQPGLEAFGGKLTYSVATGVTEFTGNPRILMDGNEYVADQFRLEGPGNQVRLRGNYRIKISNSDVLP